MQATDNAAAVLKALRFAAHKHRNQRRKDIEAAPYINHPIEVADILAREANVNDPVVLQAAILHDTIEDTETTPEELESAFGLEVRRVVEEVTDDRRLPKAERKRLQIEHAPHLSRQAQQIKVADKIANVRSMSEAAPIDWTPERCLEYLEWSARVVAGCRGCNTRLEELYEQVLEKGRSALRR